LQVDHQFRCLRLRQGGGMGAGRAESSAASVIVTAAPMLRA
jgi:hypothetical protein